MPLRSRQHCCILAPPESDLLLQDRLDALAAKHSNFKIHYIVDKSDNKAWKGR
jgi:NAD(P)H-flavin reductase